MPFRFSTVSSTFEQSEGLSIGGVYNHTTSDEQRTSRRDLGNVVRVIGKTGSVKGVSVPMRALDVCPGRRSSRISSLGIDSIYVILHESYLKYSIPNISHKIPREVICEGEDYDLHADASMDQPPFHVVIPPAGPGAEVPEVIDLLDDSSDDEVLEVERPPPPTLTIDEDGLEYIEISD
ncbi:hypothetical protein PQX77_018768 [Marasmius sp. AFHP31]|nr:hypothetical protein PQX77_018768 [Marasmius sp. AFHP31]